MLNEFGKNKLVSVYIPTFNRCSLLKRAVDSILNQTYKNIEIIIVDDGSTDDTISYLNDLVLNRKNIRFYVNEKNKGACFSRNFAINHSYGEFITGLDDDDYFLPNRIHDFVSFWEVKEESTIALYDDIFIKTADKIINKKNPKIVNKNDLLLSNSIGNQVFTKKDYLTSISGFDNEMPAWQDLDCWYRLLSKGNAQNISKRTLVIDMSHPHERITQSKLYKIESAFLLISNKLESRVDKLRLESQLLSYKISIKFFLSLVWNAFISKDFILLCFLFKERFYILLRKRVKKIFFNY